MPAIVGARVRVQKDSLSGRVTPISVFPPQGGRGIIAELAAGYGGDDAYLVSGFGGSVHTLKESDVFAIEIDVYEVA